MTTHGFRFNSYDPDATCVMPVFLAMKYQVYGDSNRGSKCTVEFVDAWLGGYRESYTKFGGKTTGHNYDIKLACHEEDYMKYVREKNLPALRFRPSRGGEDTHSPPSAKLVKKLVELAEDVARACTLQIQTYVCTEVSPPP